MFVTVFIGWADDTDPTTRLAATLLAYSDAGKLWSLFPQFLITMPEPETPKSLDNLFLYYQFYRSKYSTTESYVLVLSLRFSFPRTYAALLCAARLGVLAQPSRWVVVSLFCFFLLMSSRHNVSTCPGVAFFVLRATLTTASVPQGAQAEEDSLNEDSFMLPVAL